MALSEWPRGAGAIHDIGIEGTIALWTHHREAMRATVARLLATWTDP